MANQPNNTEREEPQRTSEDEERIRGVADQEQDDEFDDTDDLDEEEDEEADAEGTI